MKKFALLRMLCVLVALAVLSCLSLPVFAQRGGHGGGGGFHGGSVGGGFHGGGGYSGYGGRGFYGGYRGGGNYGWRGGYYGWRGGYWGYGGYGYGWGLGFGFGWPYWWGYPYAYSYSPGWGAPYPYYYPNDCPPGYTCTYNGNDDPPPSKPDPKSENYPAKPWRPSVPEGPADANYDTSAVVASETRTPVLSADRMTATPSNYRVVHRATQEDPPLRPEVRNAMHALREMPLFAREREIETGRYSDFSPQEKEFLRSLN